MRNVNLCFILLTPAVYGKEKQTIHYSMLIQGSPSNGTFSWINPYKYRNPFITFMMLCSDQSENNNSSLLVTET